MNSISGATRSVLGQSAFSSPVVPKMGVPQDLVEISGAPRLDGGNGFISLALPAMVGVGVGGVGGGVAGVAAGAWLGASHGGAVGAVGALAGGAGGAVLGAFLGGVAGFNIGRFTM